MVPILRLFMDRVHRRLIASMFRCNDAMQAYIRKSGTPYDNTTENQYICTTLHLCRIGLMNHRRCNALNSYSDKSVMMRLAVSAVPYFYRYSNPTANKRGKNVGCIVSNRGGSLWRRDGSVWRFRPRKSRLESLYLCTRATGCIVRLQGAVGIGSPAIRLRTDFYVRQNIARCVSSNSILFGLLPKTLAMAFVFSPRQSTNFVLLCTRLVENVALAGGWAVPPKSGSLIPNLRLERAWWLMSRNH